MIAAANPATIRRGDYVTITTLTGRCAGQYGEVICIFRDSVTVLTADHSAYVVLIADTRLLEPATAQERNR